MTTFAQNGTFCTFVTFVRFAQSVDSGRFWASLLYTAWYYPGPVHPAQPCPGVPSPCVLPTRPSMSLGVTVQNGTLGA